MTQDEKRIRCLRRRMDFLVVRTDGGKNKSLSYDCEELLALKWAIFRLSPVKKAVRLPIRSEDIE